jgi:hypothetical protein
MKKHDWVILREAEDMGLVVAMTSTVERNRTTLNNELSAYFKTKLPNYSGIFDEETYEDILDQINSYIDEHNIDKHELTFPITEGSDIYLIRITDNLQLKILIADEYYGDGDYSKYISIDFFVINENTTSKDVDVLTDFIEKYISQS